jgi:hypothetical protein
MGEVFFGLVTEDKTPRSKHTSSSLLKHAKIHIPMTENQRDRKSVTIILFLAVSASSLIWATCAVVFGLISNLFHLVDPRVFLRCFWCINWGFIGLTLRSRAMEKHDADAGPYRSTYLFIVPASCMAVFGLLTKSAVASDGLIFYSLSPILCLLLGYRPILELKEWVKDKIL